MDLVSKNGRRHHASIDRQVDVIPLFVIDAHAVRPNLGRRLELAVIDSVADHLTRLQRGHLGPAIADHTMWPARYWQLWSDQIIHTIHRRVLLHVKHLSEDHEPKRNDV